MADAPLNRSRNIVVDHYLTPLENGLSARDAILHVIDNAKYTIDFGIFNFTNKQIADALLAAKARKVKVRGVADATQSTGLYSQVNRLRDAGLDLKIWSGSDAIFHDKALVADVKYPRLARAVIGSTNWTGGAFERNNEVLAVLGGTDVSKVFGKALVAQIAVAYGQAK